MILPHTSTYGCNVWASTYFWPCSVNDHSTGGIMPTQSSIHLSISPNANSEYKCPLSASTLCPDPLLSSCGVICSAGSRHLDSKLHRPTQVPTGFTWYADLGGSFLLFPPPRHVYLFIFSSTHIWLISSHLMPSYQVAYVKIILKVNNNTIINTVGHVYLYYFQYVTI